MIKPTGACTAGVKVRFTRQRTVGKIARHSGADIAAGATPGRPWHSTLRPMGTEWPFLVANRAPRQILMRAVQRYGSLWPGQKLPVNVVPLAGKSISISAASGHRAKDGDCKWSLIGVRWPGRGEV